MNDDLNEHILPLKCRLRALNLNIKRKLPVHKLVCEPNEDFIDGEKIFGYKPYQIRRKKVIK